MANPFLAAPAVKKNPFLDDAPAPQQGPAMPTPDQLRQSRIDTAAQAGAGGVEHARMGDYSELGKVAEYVGGATNLLTDAYTMGLEKPLTAVGNMLFGSREDDSTAGERYKAGAKAYDTRMAESEDKSGNLGTAAKVIGTVAAPGQGRGTLVRKLAQGAVTGAIEGAARNSDDLGDAALGTVTGGGLGLVGTGVGEAVGKLADVGLKKVGAAIQNFTASPSLRARLDVFRAAEAAGLTPQQVQDMARQMGAEGMVVDVLGREGTALGRRSANLSPDARSILEDSMEGRKAGQNQRVVNTIQDVAGVPAENSRQSVDELVEATRRSMQPPITEAYRAAKAAGHDLPRTPFESLHRAPMFSQAYREAEGSVLNRVALEGDDAASELARLDETKKILDDIGTSGRRTGDLNRAGQGEGLARQLRETMDSQMGGPEYSAARRAARGSFEARRAAQRGGDLAGGRIDIEAPGQAAAVTDPLQRRLQKIGYALQQSENILNKGNTDAVPSLLERPLQQEALASVFDPHEAARINSRLGVERGFNRTAKELTGNSTTARQIAEMLGGGALTGAGFSYLTGMADPWTGGAMGAMAGAGKLVGPMLKRAVGTKAVTASPEIARLLTMPADQLRLERPIIENMMERASPAVRDVLAKLIMRSSVAGGTRGE